MDELNHEPETKSTNKTRDLQDIIIRAIRAGHEDPLSIARYSHNWYMDSGSDIQIGVLAYAVTHLLPTVIAKMKKDEAASSSPRKRSYISSEERANITAKVKANVKKTLDRKWVESVGNMTGSQVRDAKRLPDEMAARVGDNQRVNEVFTVEELDAVALKS